LQSFKEMCANWQRRASRSFDLLHLTYYCIELLVLEDMRHYDLNMNQVTVLNIYCNTRTVPFQYNVAMYMYIANSTLFVIGMLLKSQNTSLVNTSVNCTVSVNYFAKSFAN